MKDPKERSVVLSGIGVVTPFASCWSDAYEAACANRAVMGAWRPELDPPSAKARLGLVKDYPKARYGDDRQLRLMDRAMSLSVVAAGLALDDANICADYRRDIGEDIGTIVGSMCGELPSQYRFAAPLVASASATANPAHFATISPNSVCGQIAMRFKLRGWSTTVSCGEASGLHALARAIALVRSGRAPVVVVGAYEVLSKISLHFIKKRWETEGRTSLFMDDSNSDAPAEGACFFVIESADNAARRRATPYARLGRATHGFLHGECAEECDEIVRRHLTGAGESGGAVDVIASGVGASERTAFEAEKNLVSSVARANPGAAEMRTRPIFGDAGSQSVFLQVASVAQMLKNQRVEEVFLREPCRRGRHEGVEVPKRLSHAVITQSTGRGAWGLLSMERFPAVHRPA